MSPKATLIASLIPSVLLALVITTAAPTFAQSSPANCGQLVLYNGKIATMDQHDTIVSSVMIRDGKITSVGMGHGVPKHDACAKLINLRGHTAIPGLIDSHVHLVALSQRPGNDTRLDLTTSIAEVQAAIRNRATTVKPGEWITAIGGWNPAQLAEKRLPTLAELDAAAPNNPVFVFPGLFGPTSTNSLGKAFFESKGIAVAADGTIATGRDENPSLDALYALRSIQTFEDLERTALHAMTYASSFGLTTLDDQGGGAPPFNFAPGPAFGTTPIWKGLLEITRNSSAIDPFTGYDYLLALHREGKMTVRLRLFFYLRDLQADLPMLTQRLNNQWRDFGDDWMRASGIGEWASSGDLRNPPPLYEQALRLIAEKGWAYSQHTNGLEDQRAITQVWEKVNDMMPIAKLRWDLDHDDGVDMETLNRLKEMGAGVSPNRRAPLRTILESGINFGYGSDGGSVEPLDPWLHMYYIVTGKNGAGDVVNPGQTLTRLEALRHYTIANAWFTGEEDRLGSIEAGKLADIAVLSNDYLDPVRVPDDAIKQLSSVLTIVGGKIVYDTGAFGSVAGPN